MIKSSSDKVSKVLSLMQRVAERVTTIEYPEGRSRSVDMIVEHRAGERTIVKVSNNISSRKKDFAELKRISEFLNVNALVVTDQYNREKLLENVLYIRGRIGMVSPQTLESICNDEPVYIYEYQGSYYVKVNGEALKELRSRYKLGYSMLAKMLGITSKALYEYEQGRMSMSIEVAERFLNVFGKDFEYALETIDIFRFRIPSKRERAEMSRDRRDGKGCLAEKLLELGLGAVEVFNHIPSDLVVKAGALKAFIALISTGGSSVDKLAKKCKENTKLAHELGGQSITLIGDNASKDVKYVAEECSDAIGRSLRDLAEIVYREARR